MSRVRRPPPLPPPPARDSVPVRDVPAPIRPHAEWADKHLGNDDGKLDRSELDAYRAAYGSNAGLRPTLDALSRQFELGTTTPATRTVVSPEASALAARLVHAGGSADGLDVAAVSREVAALPVELLRRIEASGIRFVACRESVTDELASLRGVTPRGWPPGSTWDQVPGLYDPGTKRVVVATKSGPSGARVVPETGNAHGSAELLLHELGHALDANKTLGFTSANADFRRAWDADRPALERAHETYLLQPGDAGPQEALAEVLARVLGKHSAEADRTPHLRDFVTHHLDRLGVHD